MGVIMKSGIQYGGGASSIDIKVVVAQADLTLEASDAQAINLPFTAPIGYKAILAIPQSTTDLTWCWVSCQLESQNSVAAAIRSTGQAGTYPIIARVLCVKDV